MKHWNRFSILGNFLEQVREKHNLDRYISTCLGGRLNLDQVYLSIVLYLFVCFPRLQGKQIGRHGKSQEALPFRDKILLYPVVATSLDGSPANLNHRSTPARQITIKKNLILLHFLLVCHVYQTLD